MMLKEAKEELQRAHCFLAPNTGWYMSDSPANAALTQASNMPYPLECWRCTNHSNTKQRAERYHTWRNCQQKLDPEKAKNVKQGLSELYKSRKNRKLDFSRPMEGDHPPQQRIGRIPEHYSVPKEYNGSQTNCHCHHDQVPPS
jgi:hypothetical protein